MTLFKGIMLGSLIGGALSLFNKQTRNSSLQSIQKFKQSVTDLDSITETITNTSEKLRATAEKVTDDISFVLEKVEELKQVTPAIASIVKETKDAFYHGGTKQKNNTQINSTQYLP